MSELNDFNVLKTLQSIVSTKYLSEKILPRRVLPNLGEPSTQFLSQVIPNASKHPAVVHPKNVSGLLPTTAHRSVSSTNTQAQTADDSFSNQWQTSFTEYEFLQDVDDDHCITYAKEELDVGDNSMNTNDDDDHCTTVKNENEPVSIREFFGSYFIFLSSQLDGEQVHYELIRNQKGREKLYADGYGFHRNGKRAATTRWICENYNSSKCSATATTIETVRGDIKVRRANVDSHNHHPDPLRKKKFIAR